MKNFYMPKTRIYNTKNKKGRKNDKKIRNQIP